MRACVRSIRHGAPGLTKEHLESTALSISQCEKILAESREGELRLNDSEDAKIRLRALVGLVTGADVEAKPASAPVRAKTAKAGQRNPYRDPIREPNTAAAHA